MSGRGLDLTQRQIRALCAGAKKEGCVAEVQIGKAVVRLIPEEHAIPVKATPQVDERKVIRL
jgi:hypothetical protein